MRVGILSLSHESNTFIQAPTSFELFKKGGLLTGQAISSHFWNGNHEISGFLEGLDNLSIEALPLFYASTTPSGRITQNTCDILLELLSESRSILICILGSIIVSVTLFNKSVTLLLLFFVV